MKPVRILIFAKAPQPGRVKTRLIPALGAEGAARLAARLLERALEQARAAGVGPVELCMSPEPDSPEWASILLPPDIATNDQGEGDLGRRMARAAQRCIDCGEAALLMGTDCPGLDAERLRQAAARLQDHDAVLHPAEDGGYPLLGMNAFAPELFADMPWSTPAVARLTLERMAALGWRTWIGETLWDIDEPADLACLPKWLRQTAVIGSF
ncbi:MAG: TIGR04282 family arsenosugar biosynthesis glycosyltransferase [Pseudomonadota bacterium]